MNTFNQTTPQDFKVIDDEDDFMAAMMRLEAENPLEKATSKKNAPKTQFPCSECAGTGRYRGRRVHQDKAHCFACRGKGYFLTSPEFRAKTRAKAYAAKRSALETFQEAHETLLATLREYSSWNNFAADLWSQAQSKPLTENQIAAAYRMVDKVEAGRAAKAAERAAAPKVEVDLSPIRNMFETAVSGGYKKPVYRAEGLVLKRAPDHGRNPGALYVTDAESEEYLGKIVGTQYMGKGNAEAALLVIAADPAGAAIKYGRRTGRCSCCGRELTKHASIDAGIGPICAEKWGLL